MGAELQVDCVVICYCCLPRPDLSSVTHACNVLESHNHVYEMRRSRSHLTDGLRKSTFTLVGGESPGCVVRKETLSAPARQLRPTVNGCRPTRTSGRVAALIPTGSRHGGDSEIVAHTGALKSVQVETPTAEPAGPERRIVETSATDIYERPAADGTPLVPPHD